jgi:hypothetical protein
MEKYHQFKALIGSLDRDAVKFFQKGNARRNPFAIATPKGESIRT